MMQLTIHAVSALKPSTLGDLVDTKLKMLIRTKNRVTNSVIRPGITSGGIKKLTYKDPKWNFKNSTVHYTFISFSYSRNFPELQIGNIPMTQQQIVPTKYSIEWCKSFCVDEDELPFLQPKNCFRSLPKRSFYLLPLVGESQPRNPEQRLQLYACLQRFWTSFGWYCGSSYQL